MCHSYVFSLIAHENSKVLSIFFLPANPAQKQIILFLKLEPHYKFRVILHFVCFFKSTHQIRQILPSFVFEQVYLRCNATKVPSVFFSPCLLF